MNWKTFIIVCVSSAFISFPQNIIGCGGETDPYDYYKSFFHNGLPDAKAYTPFYYTGYNFLYDETEPVAVSDLLTKEWADYCGNGVTAKEALRFVNKFAWKDLNNLYYHIEKNQPLKIPDSVSQNKMTGYFIQQKDLEALGYIMYAKQAEPYVLGDYREWDPGVRDSAKMAKLIKNGQQLQAVAKKDFFKLKYAYQVLRLGHYSGRYTDVIKWYDELGVAGNNSSALMSQLCLALKGGALFRSGQWKESAYVFSQVFSAGTAKRISNYLGFTWSISRSENRDSYLALCKNDKEKAAMLGLFALGSAGNELNTLRDIYRLQPDAEILEVLAVREINKLEEKYLTPDLLQQAGGITVDPYEYSINVPDSMVKAAGAELQEFYPFMHQVASERKNPNSGLFETVAAYGAYINKDFGKAHTYMNAAQQLNLSQKAKDQLMLTNLLVTISEKTTIDRSFEEQLLPSIQWLQQKAKAEKPLKAGYWEVNQWADCYRNLFTEILAKRYHAQNDLTKEVLCVGTAERMNGAGTWPGAIGLMRDKLNSVEMEKLYNFMISTSSNSFEKYLLANNTLTKTDVIDFAGTAYLRDYNYDKAIEWFGKGSDKKGLVINTNPFIDLLYDRDEQLPAEAKARFSTSKLAYAQEMKRLLQQAQTDKANAAKYYYKYALGLYNATYYGHAWRLVEYYRSGSDGYYMPKDATAFKQEYYSARDAENYFEKALNAATDKNFKARCLFMMGKCSQKQVAMPQYRDYSENEWDKMDADTKAFWPRFMENKYFPRLIKEYGNTPFYKEAFNSCSYLRDFVKKK